jgi:hypothetical protein
MGIRYRALRKSPVISRLVSTDGAKVALPETGHHLFLTDAGIVDWRHERLNGSHVDEDHSVHPIYVDSAIATEPRQNPFVLLPGDQGAAAAGKAVPLASDGVDNIDLDVGVVCQVGDGDRRVQMQEHELFVAPDAGRALRRERRCTVGAHGGHETETLLTNEPLHILTKPHTSIMAGCAGPAKRRPSSDSRAVRSTRLQLGSDSPVPLPVHLTR